MTRTRIARCPRCGSSTRLDASNLYRPFCSERCKMVDLGAWLEGRYAIAGDPAGEDDPAPRAPESQDQ